MSVTPGRIVKLHSGAVSTVIPSILNPTGLAFDPQGNLIVTARTGQIYQISPDGTLTALILDPAPLEYAGDRGPLANAHLQHPNAIAFTSMGTAFVADSAVAAAIRQLTECGPLTITTTQLAPERAGVDFAQPIITSGGTGTLHWSVAGGNLPTGLSLDAATGILSGNLASIGAWDFTVVVSDSGSPGAPQQSATKNFRLYAIGNLTVITKAIPGYTLGQPVSCAAGCRRRPASLHLGLVSGKLPDYMTLDPNGYIRGGGDSPGAYPITLKVSDSESTPQSTTVDFTISVLGSVPPSIAAVVNAAFQAGGGIISPGEYITIYGSNLADTGGQSATTIPLPTILNNTQVLIGGKAIPLLYAGPSQINAYVPLDIDKSQQGLVVVHGTTSSSQLAVTQTAVQPAVYTTDLSGSGQAVAAIAGTSLIAAPVSPTSRPAVRGTDYLVLYCTGLGTVVSDVGDLPPSGGALVSRSCFTHSAKSLWSSMGFL